MRSAQKPAHSAHNHYATKRCSYHYLEDEADAHDRAAYGANYDRLVKLKNKYDPTNLFRINHNIWPTI